MRSLLLLRLYVWMWRGIGSRCCLKLFKRDYLLVEITSSWLSPPRVSKHLLCSSVLSDIFVHMSARRAPTSRIHARRCSCMASSWRFQPETSKRGFSSCLTSSWSTARRKTGVSWPSFTHHPADKTTQCRRRFLNSHYSVCFWRDGVKILWMLILHFSPWLCTPTQYLEHGPYK